MSSYSALGERLRSVDVLRLAGESLPPAEQKSRLRDPSGSILPSAIDRTEDLSALLKRIDEEMAGYRIEELPPRNRGIASASLSTETTGEAESDIPGYRELRELAEALGPEDLPRNTFSAREAGASRGLSALYARIIDVVNGVGDALKGFSIEPSPQTGGIALRLGPDGDLDIALPEKLAASSPEIVDSSCDKALRELELRLERAEAALELCAKVAEIILIILSLLAGAPTVKVIMAIVRALGQLFAQVREPPQADRKDSPEPHE